MSPFALLPRATPFVLVLLATSGVGVAGCAARGANAPSGRRAQGDPPSLLVQDGHTDTVSEAAFSEDGEVLATASVDRTLRLFLARTGRVVQVVPHESTPLKLTYVPREHGFFTVTREGTARLVDSARGDVTVLAEVPHYGPTTAALSADGTHFALGSRVLDSQFAVLSPEDRQFKTDPREREGKHIQVFELRAKRLVATLPISLEQNDLAISSDGALVAVATTETTELWTTAGPKRKWSIPTVSTGVRFAPDGTLLASLAAKFGGARTAVLALDDGKTLRTLEGTVAAVHAKGIATERYVEGGNDVFSYDAVGKEVGRVRLSKQLTSIVFSDDGARLFLGDQAGTLRVYAASGMKELAARQLPSADRRFALESNALLVSSLATTSPLHLLATGRPDGRVFFLDDTTLEPRIEVKADKASVTALEFSADGKRLVVGDDEGRMSVWSLETGERIALFALPRGEEINRVDFSDNGEVVQADGEAFTVATGARAAPLKVKTRIKYGKGTFLKSEDNRFVVNYSSYGVAVVEGQKVWDVPNTYAGGAADAGLSRDGKLVVASRDPVVRVYDVAKQQEMARLTAHTGSVTAARFSRDEHIFATGSRDGSVCLWRARDMQRVATIHIFKSDEWVTTSPRGAYVASSNASVFVNWVFRRPLEAFGFDQFARALELPEIVKKRLAGSDEDVAWTHRPPSVKLTDGAPYVVRTASAEHVIRAHVAGDGATSELRAFVDGREVDRKTLGGEGDAELRVPLLPGPNRVTVVGYDQDRFSSTPLVRSVFREAAAAARPNLHLVAIGIDKYPLVRGADLEVATADARATVAAFKKQVGGLYGAVRAETLLLDQAATPDAILRALDPLATMGAADLAVVSFAGHGIKDPRDGSTYFVTGAFDGKNLRAASVSWAEMSKRLARARGRVLVLVDACHSGSFAPGTVGPSGDIAAELNAEGRAGVVVFAASKGRQESLEVGTSSAARGLVLEQRAEAPLQSADRGHGVFTGALIEALGGAAPDADGSGAIELGELESFVVQRVRQITRGRQSPWIARREMIGDFVVAERPRAR